MVLNFGNLAYRGSALQGHLCLVAFATADCVAFPMTELKVVQYSERTALDRYPVSNIGFLCFRDTPGICVCDGLGPGTKGDMSILVDILANSFMANAESRELKIQSSGDKFWRPSEANVFFGRET